MRFAIAISAAVVVAATGLRAQQPAQAPAGDPIEVSLATTVKGHYDSIKNDLTKLVDKMPAEFFDYQPTPDVKTFAGNVAHVAQSNIAQCGTIAGHKHELSGQDLSKTMTTKAQLVGALKAGFDLCDEYFSKLADNAALIEQHYNGRMMKDGAVVPTRAQMGAMVTSLIAHDNEMYGYMAVYLRLKGVVPPTSRK